MAAALPVIGVVAAVAGTAMSAYGQIQAGNAAEAAAQYNATIAQQQAAEKAQAAKSQAFNLSEQRRMTIGKQIAAYGASGVSPNSGTPLDVLSHTASEYERDIQYAGIEAGEATQAGYEQAQLDLMYGKQAQTAGWIGAGSTLFSGLGKAAGMYFNLGGDSGMSAYSSGNTGF
jgi:hypothetical protein